MLRVVYLKHCTARIHYTSIILSSSSRIFIKFTLPKNLIKTHKYTVSFMQDFIWNVADADDTLSSMNVNEGKAAMIHPLSRVASRNRKPRKTYNSQKSSTGRGRRQWSRYVWHQVSMHPSAVVSTIAMAVYERVPGYIRPTIIICLS